MLNDKSAIFPSAKISGVASQLSGKVGQIVYRQTKWGTVAYEAPAKASVPRRSEAQMRIRTQWTNLSAVYKQFNSTLKKAFEGLTNMSDYNAFIQANTNMVKVYVQKQVRLNGGSVLAPYQITRGTLPSIVMTKNGSNILMTDIALGGLSIGDSTTVAELSNAVIAYNEDWEAGNQLTFFYGVQTVDAVTGIPRAKISGHKVVLDGTDETPLWSVVSALGFSNVGGYLGMSQVITDGAAVWIHSRENASALKVSTQFMYVDSSVLASYQTDAAMVSSADSYGGINTAAVYLNPRSGGSGGSQSGGSGSGSETGGSTGGETGGSDNGSGGGTGSVTPATVNAPTFSGETQFTESTTVTMSAESGDEIRYTTDGSTPTATTGTVYSAPLTLSETTTVKAIAVKDGVSSAVTSRVYTKSAGNADGGDDGGGYFTGD